MFGINTQEDVQKDLLRAEQVGKLQAERFIEERIKSNDVGFYEGSSIKYVRKIFRKTDMSNPLLSRRPLKTFASILATEKVAVKDKEVVVGADRDLFPRLLVIGEKREINMK